MYKTLLQPLRGGGRGEGENSAKLLALVGTRDEGIWDSEQERGCQEGYSQVEDDLVNREGSTGSKVPSPQQES